MKVVLFGATGMIGSRILNELAARGHQITAVARETDRIPRLPGVTAASADITDPNQVTDVSRGADAVISAYGPGPEKPDLLLTGTRSLIEGLKQAGVNRLLMVGGAGTLEVAPGVELLESGQLPNEWQGIAVAHHDAMQMLEDSGLEWTSFSPPAFIQPGERTGKFRLGGNSLIVDKSGQSRISAEDYAIAMVDELERPHHANRRFTVGY